MWSDIGLVRWSGGVCIKPDPGNRDYPEYPGPIPVIENPITGNPVLVPNFGQKPKTRTEFSPLINPDDWSVFFLVIALATLHTYLMVQKVGSVSKNVGHI